ncbi:MAG: phage minor capsid protein [Mediterraneibacter gnavus]
MGEVDGLCGANCKHSYFAFVDGVSVRTYNTGTIEGNGSK